MKTVLFHIRIYQFQVKMKEINSDKGLCGAMRQQETTDYLIFGVEIYSAAK